MLLAKILQKPLVSVVLEFADCHAQFHSMNNWFNSISIWPGYIATGDLEYGKYPLP